MDHSDENSRDTLVIDLSEDSSDTSFDDLEEDSSDTSFGDLEDRNHCKYCGEGECPLRDFYLALLDVQRWPHFGESKSEVRWLFCRTCNKIFHPCCAFPSLNEPFVCGILTLYRMMDGYIFECFECAK